MKKRFFYNLLILIIFFSSYVRAQDLEKSLLEWIEKHSREELISRLDTIRRKYPNSSVILFLEAYVEQDGDRAVDLYNQIIKRYPNSQFTDDALLKVAQYYYALGSYVSARQYLDNLVDQFSDSPLVPEAKYLASRCLIATGYYYSAEDELKEIIKKYPNSPFKSHAKDELDALNDLSKQEKGSLQISSLLPNPESQREIMLEKKKYTIQIGAFRDKNNATGLKEHYSQKGYLVTIDSKNVNGGFLYLVWVGEFETEEQAAAFGEVFKDLHGVSFHVVRK